MEGKTEGFRTRGLGLSETCLSGEDLDFVLAGGYDGIDDGAANIAGASSDCDDDHDGR
jgi:hypothetical protein